MPYQRYELGCFPPWEEQLTLVVVRGKSSSCCPVLYNRRQGSSHPWLASDSASENGIGREKIVKARHISAEKSTRLAEGPWKHASNIVIDTPSKRGASAGAVARAGVFDVAHLVAKSIWYPGSKSVNDLWYVSSAIMLMLSDRGIACAKM